MSHTIHNTEPATDYEYVSDIAFTPAVKAMQSRLESRASYAKMEQGRGWQDAITADLAQFIAQRDSFYMATASAEGRPYIQHRGGPPGFLKVLDEHTLAFADFSGNRQYITAGNLSENNQAYLFLMDYVNRKRIKIWGRAEIVENDQALLQLLHDPAYNALPERAMLFYVEAWDVNCPQHITPRYTEEEFAPLVQQLQDRITELEVEVAGLRGVGFTTEGTE